MVVLHLIVHCRMDIKQCQGLFTVGVGSPTLATADTNHPGAIEAGLVTL